ncbi:MAG TPA: hypothetical protein VM487_25340 [Phycisphaerae bacterium]|nr:hypothetical protein [Phycisphaerae bacterium]
MAARQQRLYDADGRLSSDLFCVCCGHNLRGLLPSAACTECATPIVWTFRGSHLYANDPGWVNRVRSGVACMALTLPWLWFPPAWLVLGLGLWRLSSPRPVRRDAREVALLAGLRVTLIGGTSLLLAYLVYEAWDPNVSLYISLRFGLAVEWIWWALSISWAGMQLGATVLIYRIAGRSDAGLLRTCRWGLCGNALAIALLGSWAVNMTANLQLEPLEILGGLGGVVVVLALVNFWATLLVAWRVLDRAEVQARRSREEVKVWQRPPPGYRWAPRAPASSPGASPASGRAGGSGGS